MMNRVSLRAALVAATLLTLAPTLARARDDHAFPEHRVDLVIPSGGIGYFTASDGYDTGILTLSIDVRYAHASGHGVMARYTHATNVWGGGHGGELDYLYRFMLAGHRDLSLGLDLALGVSAAHLEHDEQTLSVGAHFGGNAGASLDVRAHQFIASLGAQYRLLAPTEARLDGERAGLVHVVTATLGFGFTLY